MVTRSGNKGIEVTFSYDKTKAEIEAEKRRARTRASLLAHRKAQDDAQRRLEKHKSVYDRESYLYPGSQTVSAKRARYVQGRTEENETPKKNESVSGDANVIEDKSTTSSVTDFTESVKTDDIQVDSSSESQSYESDFEEDEASVVDETRMLRYIGPGETKKYFLDGKFISNTKVQNYLEKYYNDQRTITSDIDESVTSNNREREEQERKNWVNKSTAKIAFLKEHLPEYYPDYSKHPGVPERMQEYKNRQNEIVSEIEKETNPAIVNELYKQMQKLKQEKREFLQKTMPEYFPPRTTGGRPRARPRPRPNPQSRPAERPRALPRASYIFLALSLVSTAILGAIRK